MTPNTAAATAAVIAANAASNTSADDALLLMVVFIITFGVPSAIYGMYKAVDWVIKRLRKPRKIRGAVPNKRR